MCVCVCSYNVVSRTVFTRVMSPSAVSGERLVFAAVDVDVLVELGVGTLLGERRSIRSTSSDTRSSTSTSLSSVADLDFRLFMYARTEITIESYKYVGRQTSQHICTRHNEVHQSKEMSERLDVPQWQQRRRS